MRVMTFNANGIRSAQRKGFVEWFAEQQVDVLCLQELKAQDADLGAELRQLAGLHGYFHFAQKPGYSGVAVYTKAVPDAVQIGLGVEQFDREGRYVEIRFDRGQERFSLLSVYFPSGTSGDERQQVKDQFLQHFAPHLQQLRQQREVLLCGDVNIAHREIDLKNWRGNLQNSGFLPHERAWVDNLLASGMVDVYRHLYPDQEQYTWWSQRGQARAKNVGWRIDYQFATPRIAAQAQRAQVSSQPFFSDHAPLWVDYNAWY